MLYLPKKPTPNEMTSPKRRIMISGKTKGWTPSFAKSTRSAKKYMVVTPSGRTIHFGAKGYQQFRDSTGVHAWSHMDHNDPERRKRYRKRHGAIRNKRGVLAHRDPECPAYYSWNYLW